MNPMELNAPAEKTAQLVYMLNGIPCLPHYLERGVFVGIGYSKQTKRPRYSSADLLAMGATPRTMMLWPRDYSDV